MAVASGHHLPRRDVHVVDLLGSSSSTSPPFDVRDLLLGEVAVLGQRLVGLRLDEAVLLVGGQVVRPRR